MRLLDTAASGDNLIADSRLGVIESTRRAIRPRRCPPPDYVSSCVTGFDHVAGRVRGRLRLHDGQWGTPATDRTTTGFIRYSTKTGKPTQVDGVSMFKGQAGRHISVWWTNATGKTLIGGIRPPAESASA